MATPNKVPADLVIPPRPQLVEALMAERGKAEPDLARLEKLIAGDVGVAGALLKTANSPLLGARRKISSLPQAFQVLGSRNIINIASGLVLRYMMKGGDPAAMERFWDSTEQVAIICAGLARRLKAIDQDEAYAYGLFHDCGIPVLMLRFPNYQEVFRVKSVHPEGSFTEAEQSVLGTNHGAVGSLLARSWGMADEVTEAILFHHDPAYFADREHGNANARTLIALTHLAEHVHHEIGRGVDDIDWDNFRDRTLGHFGLSLEDVRDLADSFLGD